MTTDKTYKMQTPSDCGPAALAFATGLPLEVIYQTWKWEYRDGLLDDLKDSPWHHFAVLKKLNMPWRIVTCGDILKGKCQFNRTMVLLHDPSSPYLNQHWVVMQNVSSNFVFVHFGDGRIHSYSHENFQKLYADGSPACAYEVGVGSMELKWYQRLWVWFTNEFIP